MNQNDLPDRSGADVTRRVVERLPGFYRAREKSSLLHNFVSGFANIINEQQKELSRIARSHWVSHAIGIDLDRLAALIALERKRGETDDQFRARIKDTPVDFKRGATMKAIKAQVAAYLSASADDIVIIENPQSDMKVEKLVTSGDTWTLSSNSVNDEETTIVVSLEDGEASEPTIVDVDNNLVFKYKRTLKKGERLEIRRGKAKIDGVDAAQDFSIERYENSPSESRSGSKSAHKDVPKISRKQSKWLYKEKLTDTIGRFDQSKFDESIFFKLVPPTKISFIWKAHLLASIEVKVPTWLVEKNNLTKEDLEILVNAIKAAGIQSYVTLSGSSSENGKIKEKEVGLAPQIPSAESTTRK